MKIGIITIHNSPNYGACLQAFALWKYLEMQGHDVEIIDLYRPYQKEYVPSKRFKRMRQNTSFANRCKQIIKKILDIKKGKAGHFFSVNAKQKFDEFNSQIKYSRAYKGIDDLYADPPIYDLYISGSDQLWNPTQPYCLEPYFLTFVPNGRRKISYATSIGIIDLTDEEKRKFKDWLSSYEAISVREKQGQKLLQVITGRNDIKQVLDPTFLLDRDIWKQMAIYPELDRPYLLLFTLGFSKEMLVYAKRLAKESGLLLVVLTQRQPTCKDGSYMAIRDAGPKDFLGYIARAKMVITDSFHCTVFSLILETGNFYTYISPNSNRGSRIEDLLANFSLSNHIIFNYDLRFADLQQNSIDYDKVLNIIEKDRVNSQSFLDEWINITK